MTARSSCRTRRPRSRVVGTPVTTPRSAASARTSAPCAPRTRPTSRISGSSRRRAGGAGSRTWCRRATAMACTAPRGCRPSSTWRWPTGSSSAGTRSATSRSGGRSPRSASGLGVEHRRHHPLAPAFLGVGQVPAPGLDLVAKARLLPERIAARDCGTDRTPQFSSGSLSHSSVPAFHGLSGSGLPALRPQHVGHHDEDAGREDEGAERGDEVERPQPARPRGR